MWDFVPLRVDMAKAFVGPPVPCSKFYRTLREPHAPELFKKLPLEVLKCKELFLYLIRSLLLTASFAFTTKENARPADFR